MANVPDGCYLQGSCRTPMDFAHFRSQVAALKPYAGIPQIPADPYNMPASHASSLLRDDPTIELKPVRRAIYYQAAAKTDDHDWCCCQCWAWYAHPGLATYLITADYFSAAQVNEVSNLEECCGGA